MNLLNMWANIANFINENWIDILLVIVGASAFIIYWVQERRKISEAASLIVLQVSKYEKCILHVPLQCMVIRQKTILKA